MFGYTPEELVGQPVATLMPEPFRSNHQQFVDNYLQSGNAKIIGIGRELAAVTKDGHEFPIYLAVSEISDGTNQYFAGIIRDISEQKAAHAAVLEHQQRVAQVGRLQFGGWPAWLAWLGIHVFFLVGFKNRLFVLLSWAWSYVTFRRGARLITGDGEKLLPKNGAQRTSPGDATKRKSTAAHAPTAPPPPPSASSGRLTSAPGLLTSQSAAS